MRRRLLVLLSLGGVIGLLASFRTWDERQAVALHVLDVGQGDAILLRSGSTDVLVDGGPDATVVQRLGAVRPAWDRQIEVLVLTHPDRDHVGGLLPALEREAVGLVLLPEIPSASEHFRAFLSSLQGQGVPIRFARAGQRLRIGNLHLTVLAPDAQMLELAERKPNHGSVVLRVDVFRPRDGRRAFSALLTGDIERPTEHHLVRRWGALLDVDVLKVPHHGSRTSSSLRFLRATSPSLAIVSVGTGNRFGHPHEAVSRRFAPRSLLRTDTHGTLSLTARGGSTALSCTRGCGGTLAEQ